VLTSLHRAEVYHRLFLVEDDPQRHGRESESATHRSSCRGFVSRSRTLTARSLVSFAGVVQCGKAPATFHNIPWDISRDIHTLFFLINHLTIISVFFFRTLWCLTEHLLTAVFLQTGGMTSKARNVLSSLTIGLVTVTFATQYPFMGSTAGQHRIIEGKVPIIVICCCEWRLLID
jgi:hypothetical protein